MAKFALGIILSIILLMSGLGYDVNYAEARGDDEPCSYTSPHSFLKISNDPWKCEKVDYWVPEKCGIKAGLYKTDASCQLPPAAAEPAPAEPQWQDEVRVVLTPGEGTEFKLTMEEGAVARFSWVSEGGPINFDTHGDGGGQSISYEKGRGVPEDEGQLEAAFTGNHGWFFRNRNDNDITLVLRTGGDYGQLKKML